MQPPLEVVALEISDFTAVGIVAGSEGAVGVPTERVRLFSQWMVWAPPLRRSSGTALPLAASTSPGCLKTCARKPTEPSEKSAHSVPSGRLHGAACAGADHSAKARTARSRTRARPGRIAREW